MESKKLIRLFTKFFTETQYDIEFEPSDSNEQITMISIGKTYNSCEHETLNENVTDALEKFNLKHLGTIYGTTSLLGSDKRVYVAFMGYKDIPSSDIKYLEYAYENEYNDANANVYAKLLELNLVK